MTNTSMVTCHHVCGELTCQYDETMLIRDFNLATDNQKFYECFKTGMIDKQRKLFPV